MLHILLYAFRRLRTGYGEDMQVCMQAFNHAINQKGWDSDLCWKGSDNMKLGCVFHTKQLSHDCCVSSPILWFHGQNHQLRNGVCLVHDLRIACLLFADDVFLLAGLASCNETCGWNEMSLWFGNKNYVVRFLEKISDFWFHEKSCKAKSPEWKCCVWPATQPW